MSLDALIYCDCFERGALKSSPRAEWQVFVTENGARETSASDLDSQLAFDQWNYDQACCHEGGVLLHHRIGNIALVGFIRSALTERPDDFRVILDKVVYSGTHCGDYLTPQQVSELMPEIDRLSHVHCEREQDKQILNAFEQQLRELAAAVQAVGKPLDF